MVPKGCILEGIGVPLSPLLSGWDPIPTWFRHWYFGHGTGECSTSPSETHPPSPVVRPGGLVGPVVVRSPVGAEDLVPNSISFNAAMDACQKGEEESRPTEGGLWRTWKTW